MSGSTRGKGRGDTTKSQSVRSGLLGTAPEARQFRGQVGPQTPRTASMANYPHLPPGRWDSSEASGLTTSAASDSFPQSPILQILRVTFYFTASHGASPLLFSCLQWALWSILILYRDFQPTPQSFSMTTEWSVVQLRGGVPP